MFHRDFDLLLGKSGISGFASVSGMHPGHDFKTIAATTGSVVKRNYRFEILAIE